MKENELSKIIIGCAMKVHSRLGPGLLESAYEACLAYELSKAGLRFERQKPMPLIYDEVKLDVGYRLDLIVESLVVIDPKSVEALTPIFTAQMLTYLKLSGCKLGLIINFNVEHLRDGIKRVVRGL
ncbi:MAG: GxxExxY protein [Verrucomicrobia bacterium]|nr:GxxExxY protein [Verrucomicrobiota bacterium]